MANFNQAFDYLMPLEVPAGHPGAVTNNSHDSGGRTRYGLAEKWNSDLTAVGFYDAMPDQQALGIAQHRYMTRYWGPVGGPQLQSQALANKLLSLGVNVGPGRVVRWVQDALGLYVDGLAGQNTIAAMNKRSSEAFAALSSAATSHYKDLVIEDPEQSVFIDGWLKRAGDAG